MILLGYLGSWLMAGAFIAIGACISALTKNQVIAFVLGAAACFLFLMSGVDAGAGGVPRLGAAARRSTPWRRSASSPISAR